MIIFSLFFIMHPVEALHGLFVAPIVLAGQRGIRAGLLAAVVAIVLQSILLISQKDSDYLFAYKSFVMGTWGLFVFFGILSGLFFRYISGLQRRVLQAEHKLANENKALADIGRIIGSSLKIESIFDPFSVQVKKIIPFDRIAVNLVDLGENTFCDIYHKGVDVPERRVGDAHSMNGSITGEVIRAKTSLMYCIDDVKEFTSQYPSSIPGCNVGFRSFLSAPLVSRDEIIGTLHIRSKDKNKYTSDHLNIIERIAFQIAGAIANAQIHSQYVQTAEALQETELRFRTLVENASDGIVVLQDDRAVYQNPVHRSIFGDYAGESSEKALIDLLATEDLDLVALDGQLRLGGDDSKDKYLQVSSENGEVLTLEATTKVIHFDGQPAVMVMLRDITERKRLEQQLIRTQRMEALGNLAGGVAHEFNNLFSAILGYTELSRRSQRNGAVTGFLDEIEGATERAAELTKQILGFARRQIISLKICNLNDLILNMENLIRSQISETTDLELILSSGLDLVRVDSDQIQQVLINLVMNARLAMPNGGKLHLRTYNLRVNEDISKGSLEIAAGQYAVLSVSDTGVGMSEEVAARAFEPFYTTRDVGEGTGLGLSTCHGTLTQHGGGIDVESQVGKGTTFSIYLPTFHGTTNKSENNDRVD